MAGRPRKYINGTKNVTLCFPAELVREVLDKIDEMAEREDKSRSEWVFMELVEAIERKYPGNPISPLYVYSEQSKLPKTIQAKFLHRDMSKALQGYKEAIKEIGELKNLRRKPPRYHFLIKQKEDGLNTIKSLMPKAAGLSKVALTKEFDTLFEEIHKILTKPKDNCKT